MQWREFSKEEFNYTEQSLACVGGLSAQIVLILPV
jgi:hypothetical protein